MEKPLYIAGLDIGTTKVACIVGERKENGKINILGYAKTESTGVKHGMVFNIDETVTAIQRAVEEASNQSNIRIKSVNVGIAGRHIRSLCHHGQMIRETPDKTITMDELEKMRDEAFKIAIEPGEEIIDVIPQEYIIDNEPDIRNPKGMIGLQVEANYHVIIARVDSVRNIMTCINKAGLEMEHLILEPIASARAVIDDDEREAGVALVDMGGGTTDIAVFHDNILYHTAVIPFAGNVITDDIHKGCLIIKKQAEAIKVQYGSAMATENRTDEYVSIPGIRGSQPKEISLQNLASIIQARVEEILDCVNMEIQKVNPAHKLISGIVLTGGGAMLKHVQQLAEFKTGMNVRIGYPDEYLSNENVDELKSPIYSTGIGLVLEGIKRYEHEILVNKRQPEIFEENEEPAEPEEDVVTEPVNPKDKDGFIKKILSRLIHNINDIDQNIE